MTIELGVGLDAGSSKMIHICRNGKTHSNGSKRPTISSVHILHTAATVCDGVLLDKFAHIERPADTSKLGTKAIKSEKSGSCTDSRRETIPDDAESDEKDTPGWEGNGPNCAKEEPDYECPSAVSINHGMVTRVPEDVVCHVN